MEKVRAKRFYHLVEGIEYDRFSHTFDQGNGVYKVSGLISEPESTEAGETHLVASFNTKAETLAFIKKSRIYY